MASVIFDSGVWARDKRKNPEKNSIVSKKNDVEVKPNMHNHLHFAQNANEHSIRWEALVRPTEGQSTRGEA